MRNIPGSRRTGPGINHSERGFAPRHASAEASAMSAVALAKAELPDTLSREPLRRLASAFARSATARPRWSLGGGGPFAWLTSLRSFASFYIRLARPKPCATCSRDVTSDNVAQPLGLLSGDIMSTSRNWQKTFVVILMLAALVTFRQISQAQGQAQ